MMYLFAVAVITCLIGSSLTAPLDFGLTDIGCDLDGYAGPCNNDYYYRGLGRLGLSVGGSLSAGDSLDLSTLSANILPRYVDYLSFGYPRVQSARENFVRGNAFGTTEVGVRDEVSVRPTGVRSGYPRYNCNIYPFSMLSYCRNPYYDSGIPTVDDIAYRRPFPVGLGVGGAVGLDGLLLRR